MPTLETFIVSNELKAIKPVLNLEVEDPAYAGNFPGMSGDELIEAQFAQLSATRRLLVELGSPDEDLESYCTGVRSYIIENEHLPKVAVNKTVAELQRGVSLGFGRLVIDEQILGEQLLGAGFDDGLAVARNIFRNGKDYQLSGDGCLAPVA